MASPLFGLGAGIAGGAATGATFGPIGALIGGGAGGLLGGISSLIATQDAKEKKKKAMHTAKIIAMRNRAAQLGGDTSYLDARMQADQINNQFQEPQADYAGLIGTAAQAAGNLRQNVRADEAERLLRDKLAYQEQNAFNSTLSGGGRMNGRLPF